ncbi:hypothetical protein [Paenibacillus protaetiae]|uniref:hypothetical protein n=1 Tax=Paenibacillus protaetiae TaxID=2509456 RepID=UPI0013EC0F71|nr:hypothetical protein [Paenibacillus protaetiae]
MRAFETRSADPLGNSTRVWGCSDGYSLTETSQGVGGAEASELGLNVMKLMRWRVAET